MERFRDRRHAGRLLAERVAAVDLVHAVVLALPRGGVPVAHEIAAALGAPFDVLVARKVGAPRQPEYGIGAIAEGGAQYVDELAARAVGVDAARFAVLAAAERRELDRRVARYRGGRALPGVEGGDVVIVDDGLATGVTARAAILAIRRLRPRRIVLAVPVAAPDTARRFSAVADEVVTVLRPTRFAAVGEWYVDFDQTGDDEVVDLLSDQQRGDR